MGASPDASRAWFEVEVEVEVVVVVKVAAVAALAVGRCSRWVRVEGRTLIADETPGTR